MQYFRINMNTKYEKVKSKNKASYNVCQKTMSLSKVVAQRSNWSFKHTYQQYLKNKVCLQNTVTYTTSLMFHRMT